MPLVLGLDLGTSAVKAVALDEAGRAVARAGAEYPLSTPRPAWVEQDPADWWRAVQQVCRAVVSDLGDARRIAGLALSGQMNGAVFVDACGAPLRPAILWLDGRAAADCTEAMERAGAAIEGLRATPLQPVHSAAKLLWTRAHEPEVWQAAYRFLEPKDWIVQRLTGRFGTDHSDASSTLLLNLQERRWALDVWEPLGIRPGLLPELHRSVDLVGSVTPGAAQATGLAPGTPVAAGGADMACMAVGSGVIRPGIASVTIGTAGHATTAAETVDARGYNRIYPMCHAVPERYFWLGCTYTAGMALKWYRDAFAASEREVAALTGETAYDLLTRAAATVPPGSEGLFFLPWLAGAATPHPDPYARGGFLGFTLRHGKPHCARAILEGVAYSLRDSLEVFAEIGLAPDEIRIGEGGSRSSLWRQIQADVFNRPLRQLRVDDASAVGAAIIAGVAAGLFPDFETGCARAVTTGGVTVPDPASAAAYEWLYHIYQRLYPRLAESFGEMAAVVERGA